MTETKDNFDAKVWRVVSRIAAGQVMSYGEVARAAGYPRHARMVSKAMSRSTEPLPWYRVVRSDRTLAFEAGSPAYKKQRESLEKEGVQFINGKVVASEPDEDESLDEILWGPPE